MSLSMYVLFSPRLPHWEPCRELHDDSLASLYIPLAWVPAAQTQKAPALSSGLGSPGNRGSRPLLARRGTKGAGDQTTSGYSYGCSPPGGTQSSLGPGTFRILRSQPGQARGLG